jgi:hypothetical protein
VLLEGQYSVKQRDTFGPEWSLHLALALFLTQ